MRGISITVLCVNFVLSVFVSADCQINGIELQKRTVFYRYPANGPMQLLLASSVPIGTELILACADSLKTMTAYCTASQTIGMKTENCPGALKTVGIQANDMERMHTCSFPLKDYKVGYNFANYFFELYRVCFDDDIKRTLFTQNAFEPFSDALKNTRPEASFTTGLGYTGKLDAQLSPASICKTFQNLLAGSSPIIQVTEPNSKGQIIQPCVIARGHLTSQNDFFQNCNKKATFKLFNTVPQFQSINTKNWLRIEEFSKGAYPGRSIIITGSLGVLELVNAQNMLTQMYLLGPNKAPIPTWMYKIVAHQGQCTIILTYNNIYGNAPQTVCTAVCPGALRRRLSHEAGAGETFCCTPQQFQQFANINHGVC